PTRSTAWATTARTTVGAAAAAGTPAAVSAATRSVWTVITGWGHSVGGGATSPIPSTTRAICPGGTEARSASERTPPEWAVTVSAVRRGLRCRATGAV